MRAQLLLFVFIAGIAAGYAQKGYPSPPDTPARLFYIQHDRNHNTFVYDAKISKGKLIDVDEPIDIYRIAYTKDGRRQDLSMLQRKLAYGVTCKNLGNGHYEFCLVSFPDKKLYMKPGPGGKHIVTVTINGKEMVLDRIFIATKNDSILHPELDYAEFCGKCPKTGRLIREKFYPKA